MFSFTSKPISRIAVVGVGSVGGAVAYALTVSSVAREILLVDVDIGKRDGQVRDLSDAAYGSRRHTRIRAATHREAGQCDIVVVAAGCKYPIGEPNIQHMNRNISMVRSIIDAMVPFRDDTILLLVSNPVDVVTSLAKELSGLPISQVIGSGTFLDSVRLRGLVADKTEIAANSIDLYVVGVRGHNQVVAWSTATIGGVPIDKSVLTSDINRDELEEECKHRSESIIRNKGAMPFGIGSTVASLCSSILMDKRNVRAVSHFQPEFGCCFSLPVVLGRKGILRTIHMPLTRDEEDEIAISVKALKGTVDRINKGK